MKVKRSAVSLYQKGTISGPFFVARFSIDVTWAGRGLKSL
jgi:hypothetical protein